jgi:hypothetical protein
MLKDIKINYISTQYNTQMKIQWKTCNLKTRWGMMIILLKISAPFHFNPYPTAFPYGNGMVLYLYQQQESSTTKTVHKVINKRLKTYVVRISINL